MGVNLILLSIIVLALAFVYTAIGITHALTATIYLHIKNIPLFTDRVVITMYDQAGTATFIKPWRITLYPFINDNMDFKISNVLKSQSVKLCIKSINELPGKTACKTASLDDRALDFDYYFDYNRDFVR